MKQLDQLIEILSSINTQPEKWDKQQKTEIHYKIEEALALAIVARVEIERLLGEEGNKC
jgi:hypothetical protein